MAMAINVIDADSQEILKSKLNDESQENQYLYTDQDQNNHVFIIKPKFN